MNHAELLKEHESKLPHALDDLMDSIGIVASDDVENDS